MGRYLVIEKPKPRAERLGNAMLEDSTTIFVGNLSFKTESEDIRGFFSSCGDIVSCRIAL